MPTLNEVLSDIDRRLIRLEGNLMATDDYAHALRDVLYAALRLLHLRGVLLLPELIVALRSESMFVQLGFDVRPPANLEALVAHLESVAKALDKESGRPA